VKLFLKYSSLCDHGTVPDRRTDNLLGKILSFCRGLQTLGDLCFALCCVKILCDCVLQVSHVSENDDSDPDYTPSGKRLSGGSGRKKRIKVEADAELDHLLEDTDGAEADGSLDGSLLSSFRNRSLVWQVFVKEPDGEYVKCTICGTRLKLLSGSTTTMLNHYISKHTEEYHEALMNRVQAVRTH